MQHPGRPLVGAERRRPACPTGRAASRRRASVVQRPARWRRRRPRSGPPGRCRRRRRGRRGARPPRGRGCSCSMRRAASCGQPRQRQRRCPGRARTGRGSVPIVVAPQLQRRRSTASTAADHAAAGAHQLARRAARSGASQRSGPGPATPRPRSAAERRRRWPAPGCSGAAESSPRPAQTSSTASDPAQVGHRSAQLAGRRPAHGHVVLLHRARWAASRRWPARPGAGSRPPSRPACSGRSSGPS